MRTNSFFTHLKYDVRCVIYDFMDLPPILHSNVGFVMSCKQAKAETKRAATQNVNRFIKALQATAQQQGHHFIWSKFAPTTKFADLNNISISVGWDFIVHLDWVWQLLSCYFSRVTVACKSAAELQALDRTAHSIQVHMPAAVVGLLYRNVFCRLKANVFLRVLARCIKEGREGQS